MTRSFWKRRKGEPLLFLYDRVLYSDILLHKIDLDLQSSSNKRTAI